MMSKTYGRRSGGGPSRTFSSSPFDGDASEDPYDPFAFSEEDHELEDEKILRDAYSNFNFSSQDSTYSTSQSDHNLISSSLGQHPGISLKETSSQLLASVDLSGSGATRLKAENGSKEGNRVSTSMLSRSPPQREGLATLVETEESGEIMEHVDEVNLSLDGLKRGRPIRVRRASLLSLLTICGDSEQRMRLRAPGLTKRMIDAIAHLSFDDSPSNLAAAALFYLLTTDDKDFHLLNSDSSIAFLIKLLKPLEIDVAVEKAPSIGSKLLALRKVAHNSLDTAKKIDSSSDAIFDKVKEILVDCKHMEPDDGYTDGTTRPELSPKWIALLTIEKACFSAVSLDGVETERKTREKFKGRLRELGGLDAIFELAIKFRPTLEDWLENTSTLNRKLKVEENIQCLVLLLKCLRIMENCTFLSKDNQNHLLEMRKYLADQKSRLSFTELVIRFINILSDLSLLRRTLSTNSSPEFPLMIDKRDDSSAMASMRSSQECSSSGRIFPDISLKGSQDDEWLSSLCSSLCPASETISRPVEEDRCVSNVRIYSSKASSCSKTRKSLPSEASIDDDNTKICFDKSASELADFTDLEDSQDPFAFDEEEFRPSKWDVLHGRKNVNRKRKSKLARRNFEQESSCHLNARQDESEDCGSQALVNGRKLMDKKQKSKLACKDFDEGCSSQLSGQQDELQDSESRLSTQNSSSSMFNEESDKLLSDCLLTAVKVLMNLTNDNDLGCCQIASCGGLETLSSLIATHFPLFGSTLGSSSETKNCISLSNSTIDLQSQTESPPFSDQDIDFLVVILGVLVNMVEKDEDNRSRLVSSSVLLPCSTLHREERRSNIIPLLCSIFLVNQGAGETAGEGNDEPWDVEVALMQGEKEAEKMIIEAYAALLLAFLSTESFRTRKVIADRLPTHKLAVLIPVLERFVAFHVSLDMISPETHKIVKEVIESLRFS